MEILIAVSLVLSGVYTTTTFVLSLLCWRIYKEFAKSKTDLAEITTKISLEHNAMAERLMTIQEAVNSHEFKLNGNHLHFQNKK